MRSDQPTTIVIVESPPTEVPQDCTANVETGNVISMDGSSDINEGLDVEAQNFAPSRHKKKGVSNCIPKLRDMLKKK